MSLAKDEGETVADRIEAVRRSLPPKPGRQSRLGYPSIDDFAEMIGTTRQRVIDWSKGRAYPDAKNRDRLAELSRSRYKSDDFTKVAQAAQRDAEVQRLTAQVEDLAEREAQRDQTLEELRAEIATLRRSLTRAARKPA